MNRVRRSNRGFTLLELLAVMAIIGLLAGMIVTASVVVVKKQRVRTTRDVLMKLDQVLEEYLSQRNAVPAFIAVQYDRVPDDTAVLHSYRGEDYPDRPDASVFLRSVRGVGECDLLMSGLPDRYLIRTNGERDDELGAMPSVGDAWGEWPDDPRGLVYYVHPDNHLAQAFYGRCVNRRPYFVSSGPDGKFGHPGEIALSGVGVEDAQELQDQLIEWRSDNVYSYEGVDVEMAVGRAALTAVPD